MNKNSNKNNGGSFVVEAEQQGTSGRMRSLIAILDAALDIVDRDNDDDDDDHHHGDIIDLESIRPIRLGARYDGAGRTTSSSKNTCSWSSFRRPKL